MAKNTEEEFILGGGSDAALPDERARTELEADFAPLKHPSEAATREDQYLQDSKLAQMVFDEATQAANAGDENQAIARFLQAAKLAESAREWYLAGLALQRIGDFLQNPRPPCDLERAFRMYRRAVADYEACGHFTEARHLSLKLMWLRLSRASELSLSWRARVGLAIYWATAGFGYRPFRILVTALIAILVYAILYWGTNGITFVAGNDSTSIWDAIYFSGITFTTIGYGDAVPAPHMRLIALTEGALGLFTMSFFVVVLANRLRN
jgi:tetratricopeptide (TPR) repeat protein